jgi:outer membrane protein TolC
MNATGILGALLLAQAAPVVPSGGPAGTGSPAATVTVQAGGPVTPLPATATAAAPGGPRKVLTLREAIDSARSQNLDIQQLDAKVQAARELTWKAWSSYLPQVNLGAQVVRNQYEVSFDLPTGYWVRDMGTPQGPAAGGSVPGAPTNYLVYPSELSSSVIQPLTAVQGQVRLNQALVAPQAWFLIANAYKAERVIDYNVMQARRDVLFAVAQLYYGVASLQELVVVQERQVVLTKERGRD